MLCWLRRTKSTNQCSAIAGSMVCTFICLGCSEGGGSPKANQPTDGPSAANDAGSGVVGNDSGSLPCEQRVDSLTPCRGLLSECPPPEVPRGPPIPLVIGYSDCEQGVYRTRATVAPIVLPSIRTQGTTVRLELSDAACAVGIEVQSLEGWPIWPWAVEGMQVDISLWATGGSMRGGGPLWTVLHDSVTGDPLMSIYQLNGALLRSGQVLDELGLNMAVTAPVCESSRGALLAYLYDLEVATPETTIRFPNRTEGVVPSSGAPFSWRIQTGVLANTFGHLTDPNFPYFDVRWGEFFQFVAWTEPR